MAERNPRNDDVTSDEREIKRNEEDLIGSADDDFEDVDEIDDEDSDDAEEGVEDIEE